MFNNNGVKWSIIASGVALALCVLCMLAGGLTWLTGAAGWLAFLALVFSAVVGLTVFRLINLFERQDWLAERRSVIERMQDAQACIKAEEKAHEFTKRQLRDANARITEEHSDAQHHMKAAESHRNEAANMRTRCAQRDHVIKELRAELEGIKQQIQTDNDTWRQQVSNMREAAYKLAVHIEGSANGLPEEWEAWGAELAQDLRKLAAAGGVETDERQISIDDADPVAQPSQWQELTRLMSQVRENQAQRRADLGVICKAVENGYELSDAFNAAYQRGMIHVTDEVIANERRYIEHSQASE